MTSALISFLRTLVFQLAAMLLLPALGGIDGVWLFAVVDGLLIANHRFGILWSKSITFSVFSQLAFC